MITSNVVVADVGLILITRDGNTWTIFSLFHCLSLSWSRTNEGNVIDEAVFENMCA